MARKLKGQMVNKLSKEQKEKMEVTLKKMDDNRKQDNINLRDIIVKQYNWAVSERQKGLKAVEETQKTVFRLEGIITFCEGILKPKVNINDNNKN